MRHPREHIFGRKRPAHSVAEPGKDLVRFGAAAEHQPVGKARGPPPHGLEERGDDAGGDDRQHQGVAAHHAAESRHDPRVHEGHEPGQQRVDEGLADHEVQVVQVVLQDRHAARDRDPEHQGDEHQHEHDVADKLVVAEQHRVDQ